MEPGLDNLDSLQALLNICRIADGTVSVTGWGLL